MTESAYIETTGKRSLRDTDTRTLWSFPLLNRFKYIYKSKSSLPEACNKATGKKMGYHKVPMNKPTVNINIALLMSDISNSCQEYQSYHNVFLQALMLKQEQEDLIKEQRKLEQAVSTFFKNSFTG